MREAEIKALLLTRMRSKGRISTRTILANEFPVGQTAVRADLALLTQTISAVEIKSEYDSLRRLPRQLEVYRQFFDETVLAVAERHLAGVQQLDLAGVDLWCVTRCDVVRVRSYPAELERTPMADLIAPSQRQKSRALNQKDGGREAFLRIFKDRFSSTSEMFWQSVGRRKVRPSDLQHLSRFQPERRRQEHLRAERDQVWRQWGGERQAA